jgi:hypothetical protein
VRGPTTASLSRFTLRSDGRFLVQLWSSYSEGLVIERPAATLKFSVTAIRVACFRGRLPQYFAAVANAAMAIVAGRPAWFVAHKKAHKTGDLGWLSMIYGVVRAF